MDLTRQTALEARRQTAANITVCAVAPGPVATELFLNGKTPEQAQALSKMPPLERLGQPDDIAQAVSFLVSPQATAAHTSPKRLARSLYFSKENFRCGISSDTEPNT